mgnify:CR=1 FL=1
MVTKLTLQELQDLHFTSVEKFFNAWATKKINQTLLNELSNTNGDVAKVVLKCLEDGINPFIANASKIKDPIENGMKLIRLLSVGKTSISSMWSNSF